MAQFRPEEMFRVLARHKVAYVLIGGVAATLHGSNLRTGDVDICPARSKENLKRLAEALLEMEPRIRSAGTPEGTRFQCDAKFFAQTQMCNLTTRFGDLDISFEPAGTSGHEDLRAHAVEFDLDGLRVPTASLEDVIRSKAAAGRPKDLAALPTLRMLREEIVRRKGRG